MGRLIALFLIASPATPQPDEAISFDAPRRLVGADGGVRWSADAGVCFDQPAYLKVDEELVRLQRVESDRADTRGKFFLGGVVLGGLATTIVAVLAWIYIPR